MFKKEKEENALYADYGILKNSVYILGKIRQYKPFLPWLMLLGVFKPYRYCIKRCGVRYIYLSDGRLTPATDTNLLPTAYRGGGHLPSDIRRKMQRLQE